MALSLATPTLMMSPTLSLWRLRRESATPAAQEAAAATAAWSRLPVAAATSAWQLLAATVTADVCASADDDAPAGPRVPRDFVTQDHPYSYVLV